MTTMQRSTAANGYGLVNKTMACPVIGKQNMHRAINGKRRNRIDAYVRIAQHAFISCDMFTDSRVGVGTSSLLRTKPKQLIRP